MVKSATLKAIEEGGSAKRARLKTGKDADMEQALIIRIKQVRSKNLPVSGELVKEKASKSQLYSISDLKDSSSGHGKSKNPICLIYKFRWIPVQTTGLDDGLIFEDFLIKWDKKLEKRNAMFCSTLTIAQLIRQI
uniref:Uncharacterized protein n=1 Tax=Ditylenchus dipsaci TaxID=166011 RepID=A0A915DVR6_9BILA